MAHKFCHYLRFYFLITKEYVKSESIVIAWVKQKNSLLLTKVHVLYALEDETSKINFRLSVCLYVRTYVDFSCGHNNFRRS